jgi:hypothetical protein
MERSRWTLRARHHRWLVGRISERPGRGEYSDASPCSDTNQDEHSHSGDEQGLAHVNFPLHPARRQSSSIRKFGMCPKSQIDSFRENAPGVNHGWRYAVVCANGCVWPQPDDGDSASQRRVMLAEFQGVVCCSSPSVGRGPKPRMNCLPYALYSERVHEIQSVFTNPLGEYPVFIAPEENKNAEEDLSYPFCRCSARIWNCCAGGCERPRWR